MRLLNEKNDNSNSDSKSKRNYFCVNNLLNSNISDIKSKLSMKRDQNSHSKIPIIIEDIKSLDMSLNDEKKSKYSERKSEPRNHSKKESKPIICHQSQSFKREPVFIRPNVDMLLRPTIR